MELFRGVDRSIIMGFAITAAAFSGCAMGRVGPGAVQERYVVDVAGRDLKDARRQAVASFFDAYLSTGARAASAQTLEGSFLAATTSYIVRDKVLSTKKDAGPDAVKARCIVDYLKLGRDLEAAGLVKPQGVVGRPRAAVWLSPRDAAEAVRGALAARGYDAMVLAGEPRAEAALDDARARGAALLISGEASGGPTDGGAPAGFARARAEISLKVYALPQGEVVDDVSAEADAVDLETSTARSKAFENCGALAADKLQKFLATQFVERDEVSVVILGMGKLPEIERLLGAVRALRGVAGAALGALGGGDSRLRVFVERLSADEVAAALLRLPGYSFTVRAVEPEFKAIELDTAGEAPF